MGKNESVYYEALGWIGIIAALIVMGVTFALIFIFAYSLGAWYLSTPDNYFEIVIVSFILFRIVVNFVNSLLNLFTPKGQEKK